MPKSKGKEAYWAEMEKTLARWDKEDAEAATMYVLTGKGRWYPGMKIVYSRFGSPRIYQGDLTGRYYWYRIQYGRRSTKYEVETEHGTIEWVPKFRITKRGQEV